MLFFYSNSYSKDTWTQTLQGGYSVNDIAVKDNTILVGTTYGLAFLSDDYGKNWISVNNVIDADRIYKTAISNKHLFASTGEGLFVSSNHGKSWALSDNDNFKRPIYVVKANGNRVIVGTTKGLFISDDDGESWTCISQGLYDKFFDAVIDDSDIFVCSQEGSVFHSTDSGKNWTFCFIDSTNRDVLDLAYNGKYLYAGTSGDGVFFSTNKGRSWTNISVGIRDYTINCLSTSGDNLVLGSYWGLLYTTTNNEKIGLNPVLIDTYYVLKNKMAIYSLGQIEDYSFHLIMDLTGKQLIMEYLEITYNIWLRVVEKYSQYHMGLVFIFLQIWAQIGRS